MVRQSISQVSRQCRCRGYYLLRYLSPWDDGDFSEGRLHLAYTQELANNLGNLVSRMPTLCQRGIYQPEIAGIPKAHDGYRRENIKVLI